MKSILVKYIFIKFLKKKKEKKLLMNLMKTAREFRENLGKFSVNFQNITISEKIFEKLQADFLRILLKLL